MTAKSVKLDLHSLPLETLQQIAVHLDSSHRPSLYAFALANKTCYHAAIPLLFHHIHLPVSCPEALQSSADALAKALFRTESARHVRCLSIKGSFQSHKHRIEGYSLRYKDRARGHFEQAGLDEIFGNDEPYTTQPPHVVYDDPVIARCSEEDLTWAPVVDLIKRLPHLIKLVYDCRNQFPPSLLDVLQNYHPQCKLHHLTFKFRTLLWGSPYPYEMALATSPCLYSIKVDCSQRDSEGDDDFNQEAVMELVAGLGPNLKEVVVINITAENSWTYRRQREPWRGLPGFVSGQSIGSLTSLSLLGEVDSNLPQVLQAWERHTNFSLLRHLVMGGGYGCERGGINGEAMEWIAHNCSFSRLKTLRILLSRDEHFVDRPNYTRNAVSLFSSFEPLDELSVSGPLEPEILDAILYQHGPTLKKLDLRPSEVKSNYGPRHLRIPMTFAKKHVLQIHAHCPALQELAIPIKRTKSDTREVEIYKTFNKMQRLRSLFLTLDCSDVAPVRASPVSNPQDHASFDAADGEMFNGGPLKKGHVREILMKCAVDETLARSIWETICQGKAGPKLESLKLFTTDGTSWGIGSGLGHLSHIVENLTRSWLIERVARDDKDIINVRELRRKAREAEDLNVTNLYRSKAKYLRLKSPREIYAEEFQEWLQKEKDTVTEWWEAAEAEEAVQVFRRIWPRKENSNSNDWREDWSSLPLQV